MSHTGNDNKAERDFEIAQETEHYVMLCINCDSDNIALVNAICLWDVAKQLWIYDDGGEFYCKSCEKNDVDIVKLTGQ